MAVIRINPGELTTAILFSSATDSEDAQLSSITTWSTSGATTHFAKVDAMNGREYAFGDKVVADCETAITMYACTDTLAKTVKDRIVAGSKTYAIASIARSENGGDGMIFACKELVL